MIKQEMVVTTNYSEILGYKAKQQLQKLLLRSDKSWNPAFIDTRIKLMMMFIFAVMFFLIHDKLTLVCAFLLAATIGMMSGKASSVLKYIVVFSLFWLLDYGIGYINNENIRLITYILTHTMLKYMPLILLGYWIMTTTDISDFVSAFEAMKLPRFIVLPFAVLLRYIPTVREELRYIKSTMKIRGIKSSLLWLILRPFNTMEYILVPLMMRSIKVAEELSAAALTRGIHGKHKRVPMRQLKIRFSDLFYGTFFIGFVLLLFVFDRYIV